MQNSWRQRPKFWWIRFNTFSDSFGNLTNMSEFLWKLSKNFEILLKIIICNVYSNPLQWLDTKAEI